MKKILFLSLILLFLVNLSKALEGSTKGFPRKAPEMKGLFTDKGKPFSLKKYKGKVLIITYGYTQCPHVCPTILSYLKQVENKLNEDGYKNKYQIIFVSVNPEDDTVERLKNYKKEHYLNNFIFLTGSKKALKKVWNNYNIYVKDKGTMTMKHNNMIMKHRMIDHTAKITIIDKRMNIREEFLGMYLPVNKIVKDVEELIKE